MIELVDLQYARVLDNAFWTTTAWLFENQIQQQIAQLARIDLSEAITETEQALGEQLKTAQPAGLSLELTALKMGLGGITVAAEELVVEALLGAEVRLSVGHELLSP